MFDGLLLEADCKQENVKYNYNNILLITYYYPITQNTCPKECRII